MARNKVCLVALIAILVSGPAFAQPADGTTGQPRRSPNTPLDFGPFTPEANRAFPDSTYPNCPIRPGLGCGPYLAHLQFGPDPNRP